MKLYFFVFVVKQNEFGAFSVQDALEAPMAAPAPRELPREFPESLRKPPRCLPDASESKKNTVWVLALGLFITNACFFHQGDAVVFT